MSESAKDLALAAALAAVGGAALIALSRTADKGAHVADVVGFATLPRLYAGILVALSALMGAGALLRMLAGRQAGSTPGAVAPLLAQRVVLIRTAGTVALTVLYVLGLERFPFFPVTAGFLGASFLLYGRRPLWAVALIAVLGAAILHGVFVGIIDLPLH
jgi:hypothetical protein